MLFAGSWLLRIARRFQGKNLLSGYLGLFGRSLIRLRLQLSVLLEKDLNFALRLLQLFAAGCRNLDSFFKQFQRLLKRHIAFLELIDNLF
jgi:hypothetical protein